MHLPVLPQTITLLWQLNNHKHIDSISELVRCQTVIVVTSDQDENSSIEVLLYQSEQKILSSVNYKNYHNLRPKKNCVKFTLPYLNLLVKPRIFPGFLEKI